MKRYREMGKPPVFSHDELLITIFERDDSKVTARWLLPCFEEMVNRELRERKSIRARVPDLIETKDLTERPDEWFQCHEDKSFCHLSQLTTEEQPFVVCNHHLESLPQGKKIVLNTPFWDSQLINMLDTLRERAGVSAPLPPPAEADGIPTGSSSSPPLGSVSRLEKKQQKVSNEIRRPCTTARECH